MYASRGASGKRGGWDLRLLAFGFFAGIAVIYELPALPRPWWLLSGVPILLILPRLLRPFLGAVLAGALCLTLHGLWLLQGRLDPALDYTDVTVRGTVVSLPSREPGRTRFIFRPAPGAPPGMARRVRVSWYRHSAPVEANQCWRFTLRVKTPRGLSNPGGFDYAGWLFRNGIGAKAYVRNAQPCRSAGVHPVLSLRAGLDRAVRKTLSGDPMLGIVLALTLGDRSDITDGQWRVFRRTGTSHLVAISGLHIGLFGSAVFLLVRWLWALFPALVTRIAAQRAAALAGVGAAGVYATLAGFGLPAQRSLVMIAMGMLAICLGRRVVSGRLWALALIVVLFINPLALGSAGFWLSFGAVAWIFYIMAGRLGRLSGWRGWLLVQAVITLGLVPMTIYFFGRASLLAAPANLVLIPIFSVLVPAVLLGVLLLVVCPPAGGFLLRAVAFVLHVLWPEWSALGNLPLAAMRATAPPAILIVPAVAGLILVLAPRGLPGRWAGLALCLPAILWRPATPAYGTFKLAVLDVGEGLSAVVRTHGHTLVFDTGPGYPGGFSAGRSVVVPYLRHAGVSHLDALVVSHGDRDHRGGAPAVLHAYPGAYRRGWHGKPCRAGQHWEWDGVVFRFIHPDGGGWGDNNGSCVLRVRAGEHAILLPGDIERSAELHLVASRKQHLRADVLIAPHHGSNSSSTGPFVQAVDPRFVVFPAGWDNQWGFPLPAVVQRYRRQGSEMWTTGRDGAVLFTIRPDRPLEQPVAWRASHCHFWNYP